MALFDEGQLMLIEKTCRTMLAVMVDEGLIATPRQVARNIIEAVGDHAKNCGVNKLWTKVTSTAITVVATAVVMLLLQRMLGG